MRALCCVFILCAFYLYSSEGDLYDIFGPCCHEGVQWSSSSFRCDNYPGPVMNISDNDQAACLSIIEVCCIKQTQLLTCESGKQTALDRMVCAIRDTEPGAEQFRECCHCCQLGLVSRDTTPGCQAPGLGEPCDSKYVECCRGEASGNLSISGPGRGRFVEYTNNNSNANGDREEFSVADNESTNIDNSNKVISSSSSNVQGNTLPEAEERRLNENGEGDIDECSLFPGQICSHFCVNTPRGFHCACPDGFTLDPSDNRTCIIGPTETESDDQTLSCELNNPCEQRCLNRNDGGVQCSCYEGYRLAIDDTSCEDIDECYENAATCPIGQVCVNTRGRFTCILTQCPAGTELNAVTGNCDPIIPTCDPGFTYSIVKGRCEDVNECGLAIDACRIGERCENTVGSYVCRRERHCGTGYTLEEENQRCVDNDECELGTHNCNGGYRCQNIQGSFRCVPKDCPLGQRFDTAVSDCIPILCPVGMRANEMGNCKDINECEEQGPNICRRHQRCINTRGSYYCRSIINCPSGYEPKETSGCQDIDECELGTHKCGPDQQCINRQGSYFCQCPRGMRHDSSGKCEDVDECSYGAAICPANSKCVNTIGSFKCDCVEGLVSDGNDACTDVDECQTEGICQQKCVNVLGTFFCSCNRGYQLRDDKRSCEDIDECTQFGGRAGRGGVCGGRCINMPGSYRCECPDGWRLKPDGRSCEDINECKEQTAYCPHTDSLCINTRGGYKCPVVQCPEGFLKTNSTGQQNSIRCKRISTDCPECRRGLISRTHNFLSFASNVIVPAPLFSMTGSRLSDKFYTWGLDLVSARPQELGVTQADVNYFSLEKSGDFARVTLLRRIEGPQDLVLKLTMNVTSYFKGYEGSAESRIHLYVTGEENDN